MRSLILHPSLLQPGVVADNGRKGTEKLVQSEGQPLRCTALGREKREREKRSVLLEIKW